MKKVFIDGKAGTTGLRIEERLFGRDDIEIVTISEELRKDPQAKKEILNSVDVAFLCLPDQAAMESVTAGRTCLMIAHRLSTVRNADMILVVKNGRIVEQGTHPELLARNGYYYELYTRQYEEEETAKILA